MKCLCNNVWTLHYANARTCFGILHFVIKSRNSIKQKTRYFLLKSLCHPPSPKKEISSAAEKPNCEVKKCREIFTPSMVKVWRPFHLLIKVSVSGVRSPLTGEPPPQNVDFSGCNWWVLLTFDTVQTKQIACLEPLFLILQIMKKNQNLILK